MAAHQIQESSRNKSRVGQTEEYFLNWMNQIKFALIQGKQVVEQKVDIGPRNELEHWRRNLSRFTAAHEFIQSKPFLNHHQCLALSRSKLVKVSKSNVRRSGSRS